jgi:hypothetical protein
MNPIPPNSIYDFQWFTDCGAVLMQVLVDDLSTPPACLVVAGVN